MSAHDLFETSVRGWGEFPDSELARARRLFRPVARPRGALLALAGEPASQVAFVARGLVRLYYADADGRERTHGFRAEGELVCAYRAALRDEPSQLSIAAVEACELLVAPFDGFRELCAGHPCWRDLVARLTEQLYVRQDRRQRELLLDDAATRYRTFVTEQAPLAARLTQRLIASYVGVTPVALSRIRRSVDLG
ncbi:Crp/Fnr family transcriptional regulator [Solihabitans fulvus]|nr:Crp/Fnr family transcriptional regulator [Solihabitans fulvus]